VADDFEIEEAVFFDGAVSDVVDDLTAVAAGDGIADDDDVEKAVVEADGNDIAGEIVEGPIGDRDGEALAFPVGHEIGDAAVVDILIRSFEAPIVWVLRKVRFHVFVNFLLQIDPDFAEGTDDDVGADAAVIGDITAGVFEADVSGIVFYGDADTGFGGRDDTGGGVGLAGLRDGGGESGCQAEQEREIPRLGRIHGSVGCGRVHTGGGYGGEGSSLTAGE
jgi:hypothetical protein